MEFEFLDSLSWRDTLIALVVLLTLYILTTFLRINRMRSENLRAQELPPTALPNATQSATSTQKKPEAPANPAPKPSRASKNKAPSKLLPKLPAHLFKPVELPTKSPQVTLLEDEVTQLRREIGSLRTEIRTLRDEREHNRAHRVQLAQDVSPFYSDAMRLATQGSEATDISAVCGISRAEAELIVALAKNGS